MILHVCLTRLKNHRLVHQRRTLSAFNMSSTKKRARSPEVDELLSTRQSTPVQTYQNAPLKRRCRGPKDDRLKALRKLEYKRNRRTNSSQGTAYQLPLARAPQLDTRVRRTAPAPVKSLHTPKPTVLHIPPAVPAECDEGGLEIFNASPVRPHVLLVPGLHTPSSVRDNCALFRQTRHLDGHTTAWNQRRNDQAANWTSVTIPQLVPIYLANRAATESGRLPPPSKPNGQCKCNKVAIKVEMVTWDREFIPHLLRLFFN